jgi:hypothetical protein
VATAKRKRVTEFTRRVQERTRRVCFALGAGDAYRRLGGVMPPRIAATRVSPPDVVLDPSLGSDSERLQMALKSSLNSTAISLNNVEVSCLDAFTVVLPFLRRYAKHVSTWESSSTGGTTWDDGHALLQSAERECWRRLTEILELCVAEFTTYDQRLFWYDLTILPQRRLRITLGAKPLERKIVEIDGRLRTAFRCGGSWGGGGFQWVRWLPEFGGGNGTGEAIPVYIQSHALHRLTQRMPVEDDARQQSLLNSLVTPVVAHRDGDRLLIKYRLVDDYHVGHLVIRLVAGAAVVTTFLFVTMQGTPEAAELRRRLQLRLPDIEYTGLDRLQTFVNCDLAKDEELGQIFEACGCGDLLRLRSDCEANPSSSLAAALRNYLGMLRS